MTDNDKNLFRQLIDDYEYRIVEKIDCDNTLCSVTIEVVKNGKKVTDVAEIYDNIEVIIDDLMYDNHFEKIKIISYSVQGNVYSQNENIYHIVWGIKPLFAQKFQQLEKYLNGKEIKILSGEFKDKIGLYEAKRTKNFTRKIEEYVIIDGEYHDLLNVDFEFVDDDDKLTWESIMEQ